MTIRLRCLEAFLREMCESDECHGYAVRFESGGTLVDVHIRVGESLGWDHRIYLADPVVAESPFPLAEIYRFLIDVVRVALVHDDVVARLGAFLQRDEHRDCLVA